MNKRSTDGARRLARTAVPRRAPAVSGPSFWGAHDRYTYLVTGEQSGGGYCVVEATLPPGGGPPLHLHRREQESLYLLQGSLDVELDNKTAPVTAGDVIHIPHATVHGFSNTGTTDAHVLLIFLPDEPGQCLEQAPQQAPDRLKGTVGR